LNACFVGKSKKGELLKWVTDVFVELITLPVGHYRQADTDTHRRNHEYEDTALQGLNHASAGSGCLGIAESAVLAKDQGGSEQGYQQCGETTKANPQILPSCAKRVHKWNAVIEYLSEEQRPQVPISLIV
jgi:hypothetical protein